MTIVSDILLVLKSMQPITLAEMSDIKLMNRIDTKFVTDERTLLQILRMAADKYFVQTIDNQTISDYDTMYYDTSDLDMYMMHHNRHLQRQKVRIRHYLSGGEFYFEIKNKNNKGRTKKKRIEISEAAMQNWELDAGIEALLRKKTPYSGDMLQPALRTAFSRITLVNYAKTERLTIDCNLLFENQKTGHSARKPGMVIIELKQDGQAASPMKEILRELRVKPLKISKYCVGTTLTDKDVKGNRFKAKIRKIDKIIHKTKTN